MTKIKCGVWGFGRMGEQHAQFYNKEKDLFELVAVCDTNEERLERAKSTFGCATYKEGAEFLADPNMELVIICTLSTAHTEQAIRALEQGKYVLLDKPIAITDAELHALREADKKYPDKLFVLHNIRFEPGFEAVQKVLLEGVLGEINMIKLRRHLRGHFFRSDWQTSLQHGGGLLNNWGNHEIDHAVQLLGCHPKEIHSYLWHVTAGGNGDDHVKIILKGTNNRLVDSEISYNVTLPEPYCTIHGQRGTLVCNAEMNEISLRYVDPDFTFPPLDLETNTLHYRNLHDGEIPWVEKTINVEESQSIWEYMDRKLFRNLHNAIRNGGTYPITNADAFETVRIMEEVKNQNPQFDWIK